MNDIGVNGSCDMSEDDIIFDEYAVCAPFWQPRTKAIVSHVNRVFCQGLENGLRAIFLAENKTYLALRQNGTNVPQLQETLHSLYLG